MKLTKKQKEKLIGKKIVVDRLFRKKDEINWSVTNPLKFNSTDNLIRTIETIPLLKPIKAVIIGFTHLCEGKFCCDDDGSRFLCTKRIPCIKIASGLIGKIQYSPIPDDKLKKELKK